MPRAVVAAGGSGRGWGSPCPPTASLCGALVGCSGRAAVAAVFSAPSMGGPGSSGQVPGAPQAESADGAAPAGSMRARALTPLRLAGRTAFSRLVTAWPLLRPTAMPTIVLAAAFSPSVQLGKVPGAGKGTGAGLGRGMRRQHPGRHAVPGDGAAHASPAPAPLLLINCHRPAHRQPPQRFRMSAKAFVATQQAAFARRAVAPRAARARVCTMVRRSAAPIAGLQAPSDGPSLPDRPPPLRCCCASLKHTLPLRPTAIHPSAGPAEPG